MLPFLKLSNQSGSSGAMTKMRKPDAKSESDLLEDSSSDELAQEAIRAAAQDLIHAVHSQDVKMVAEALQSAFSILDSLPHQEADHESDGSFKQQNVKAALESL